MKTLTFVSSIILIALGAIGYFGWEAIGASEQSLTAAIPGFIGIAMLVGAIVAGKNHAAGMHIAVLFSLFGAIAALGRLIMLAVKDGIDYRAASTLMLVAMAAVCVFYTIMAVRSFVAARRARTQ